MPQWEAAIHLTIPHPSRPTRVAIALAALWAAWIVSATALAVNQLAFHGSGIGPGPALGVVALIIQALACLLVARGNPIGRILAGMFLAIAILTLPLISILTSERSLWSAVYLALGFALKAVGVFLLYTGNSRGWFASRK
jgi:hypothetical protein